MVMSKKARMGINMKGITFKQEKNVVTLVKDKNQMIINLNEGCKINIENDICYVSNETNKVFAGTDFSNLNNAAQGLLKPFMREIQIKGSGFKAVILPNKLTLSLGFSHTVNLDIPAGITVVQDTTKKSTTKENIIFLNITSIDLNQLTLFVDQIKKSKKLNPYKLTGVLVTGQPVIKKVSSKGGKGGK